MVADITFESLMQMLKPDLLEYAASVGVDFSELENTNKDTVSKAVLALDVGLEAGPVSDEPVGPEVPVEAESEDEEAEPVSEEETELMTAEPTEDELMAPKPRREVDDPPVKQEPESASVRINRIREANS